MTTPYVPRLRPLRDAVIKSIKTTLVPRPFASVQSSPRSVTPEYIEHVARRAPACMVAVIGVKKFERMPNGLFVGPMQMAAHILAEDFANKLQAHDLVLDFAEILINHIELNTFDYPSATPAQAASFEYVWDTRLENRGYAVGTVAWDQIVEFGVNGTQDALDNEWGFGQPLAQVSVGPDQIIPDPNVPTTQVPGDYWNLTG